MDAGFDHASVNARVEVFERSLKGGADFWKAMAAAQTLDPTGMSCNLFTGRA